MYDLNSPFDMERHKKTFTDYCEVIIDPQGVVHYAVPSHTQWLENYGADINNMTKTEYIYSCPEDMYGDYLTWLLQDTQCVSCWTCGWQGNPNRKQRAVLKSLVLNGLVENRKM